MRQLINKSALNTEVTLIRKCWVKNTTKNRPERAINIFLPIEELNSFIDINSLTKLMHKRLNYY